MHFTLYWNYGKRQVVEGDSIEDAFTKAGFGGGAVHALNFYSNGQDESYEYIDKDWRKIVCPYQEQSYYDKFISLMADKGIKLISQVQITTDDLAYHVDVERARNTLLPFYIEGSALVVLMTHSESQYKMSDTMKSYWKVHIQFARKEDIYGDCGGIPNFVETDPGMEWTRYKPNWPGFNSGWSSRSQQEHCWNFEELNDTPIEDIAKIASDFMCSAAPYAMPKFPKKVFLSWAPTYVFGSDGNTSFNTQASRDCENLFWERFGDHRKVLDKIFTDYGA